MDRRTHYLDTALRLFIEHGYNGVSMDTIVAEAGGSKATLYRYFPSKEALFGGIVDDLQRQLAAVPPAPDYIDLPLQEGLRLLGSATADAALSERAIVLLRLAAGEYSRFPALAELLFTQSPERSYERFRDYLEAKQHQGEVDIADYQIAAEHFLAGLVGHQQLRMLLGADSPTPDQINDRIDAAIAMFTRTYGVGR